MKHLKHLLAVVAAFAMALVVATPAFAASDTSISVTDLQSNDSVKYYKVIEWKDNGWAITDDFKNLTKAKDATGKYVFNPTGTTEPTLAQVLECIVGTADNPGSISYDEAKAMSALAASATPMSTPAGSISGTTWTAGTTDSPVPAGLYMVLITAGQPNIVYNPAFVGADYDKNNTTNTISITAKYNNTAVAKKTPITTGKTASDADQALKAAIDSYVGQNVDFDIDTTIPVYMPSYESLKFDITDVITPGVALNTNSIKVLLNGTETAASDTTFELKNVSATGFTISFKEAYLRANAAAVTVHVDYSGTITNTAQFNLNQDNNTVTVEYTNGPDGESGSMVDKTNHYTFSIGATLLGQTSKEKKTYELYKAGVDADGNYVVDEVLISKVKGAPEVGALKDAVFGLYTDEAHTTPYKNALYPDGAKFTTGADGIITFLGLAANIEVRGGTTTTLNNGYWLYEDQAPAGYVGDKTAHHIDIKAYYETVDVPAVAANPQATPPTAAVSAYSYDRLLKYDVIVDGKTTTTYTPTYSNDGGVTIEEEHGTDIHGTEIDNTPGVELPSTGGIGTTIFYIIGAILVIGAGVVLITKRRVAKVNKAEDLEL